jgi:hypothetical protein
MMQQQYFYKVLIIFLVSISTIGIFRKVYAVTASPHPVKHEQPDGSILTIILKGDEFIHWAETTDGFTLLSNKNGVYEYAILLPDGTMGFSGIKANDPEKREL